MNKQKTFLITLLRRLSRIPNYGAIAFVELYRATLSPSVGVLRHIPLYPKPSCIFHPSCSEYAIQSFKKYNFFKAFFKSGYRVLRCNPFNTPDIDLP